MAEVAWPTRRIRSLEQNPLPISSARLSSIMPAGIQADWLHGEEGPDPRRLRSLHGGSRSRPSRTPMVRRTVIRPIPRTFDFEGRACQWRRAELLVLSGRRGGSGVNEKWLRLPAVEGIIESRTDRLSQPDPYITASTMSNYEDSQIGSIMAAEDLYGARSPEVETVQQAWAAVGGDR